MNLSRDLKKRDTESETRKVRSIERCPSLRRKPIRDGDDDSDDGGSGSPNSSMKREREFISLKKRDKNKKKIEKGFI